MSNAELHGGLLAFGMNPREYANVKPTPLTHNGEWTVRNNVTGEHRTFRVRTQKPDANFMPGRRLVSLLTGPDTGSWGDWTTLGTLEIEPRPWVKCWGKYHGTMFGRLAQTFTAAAIECAFDNDDRIDVFASTVCRICNRKLTTPESVESGIGPICAGRTR